MDRNAVVAAVRKSLAHRFSKSPVPWVLLVARFGVEGDAHAGATVKHRSRPRQDPSLPTLRQVRLVPEELLSARERQGVTVHAGEMGENITTRALDLFLLPTGTRLGLGPGAMVELSGLRNPCRQIDRFRPGLLRAVLDRDEAGNLTRKAGVMAVVIQGGRVRPGEPVTVHLPPSPHRPLEPV